MSGVAVLSENKEKMMYIGSLLDERSGVLVSATLCRPDGAPLFTGNESILHDYYKVIGYEFFDDSADMVFKLDQPAFIDRVSLAFSGRAGAVTLSVLDDKGALLAKRTMPSDFAGETATLTVGAILSSFVLRLEGNYTSFSFGKADVFGASECPISLFPSGAEVALSEGTLCPTGLVAEGEARFAAENYREKLEELYGLSLPVGEGNVLFSVTDMEEEAFSIEVTQEGGRVCGGSYRALLWASERLLSLSSAEGIRMASLKDSPMQQWRGVHVALPDRAEIPFFKRLAKYLWMPMGYNTIFLEIASKMEYRSHPRINEKWRELCRLYEEGKAPMPAHYTFLGSDILTQQEVAELCDAFRLYGLEVVPEVQTCGHTQYITTVYPELGEIDPEQQEETIDLFAADEIPAYIHCMCPRHPNYYKVTFDILDEVISVVRPTRYVHIGHDEIYTIGKCPRCREAGAAAIFAEEVTALHDHLMEKGLGTMMWSDMIEEERYETHTAIDRIPKDILCLSFTWYFHLDSTKNIEERLSEHGFSFMNGNLYSSHFPRYRERVKIPGHVGGQVSTWVAGNEAYYGYEGKIFDFLYSAEMLWNRDYQEENRRYYTAKIAAMLPRLREYLHTGRLKTYEKRPLPLPLSPLTSPCGIAKAYPAASVSNDAPLTVVVGERADRIRVTHALDRAEPRRPWQRIDRTAVYELCYTDGTIASLPIHYGVEIGRYDTAYATPLSSNLYRHEGYLATYPALPLMIKDELGADATLYTAILDNPCPEKTIQTVTFRPETKRRNTLYLFGLELEREA